MKEKKKAIIKKILAFISIVAIIISIGAIETSNGYSLIFFLGFSALLGLVASEGAE